MSILLTAASYAQFITVLVIFVLVLGVTAWVTRWMASYQKLQNANCNIEIIETARITNNKYIQLVRVGDTYMAIAVCKDTVTMLGEVSPEQLKLQDTDLNRTSFKELFQKTIKMGSSEQSESKDSDE
ncbi:MAG: flagellar biosynthetic protein FliO [Acetatifactor sp.]|nr:flagellar biosynthetic protein FliO [Acetatifactor sp.]MDE6700011.1 flagellar biosynthetic protein FliO [Acetatifactor sp.]MDE7112631.1 flagellar biosynthetic protein FliO [Acetatifactor sp.]